jgi:hypothetical protein
MLTRPSLRAIFCQHLVREIDLYNDEEMLDYLIALAQFRLAELDDR